MSDLLDYLPDERVQLPLLQAMHFKLLSFEVPHILSPDVHSSPLHIAMKALQSKFGHVKYEIGEFTISSMDAYANGLKCLTAFEATSLAAGVRCVSIDVSRESLSGQDQALLVRVFPNAEVVFFELTEVDEEEEGGGWTEA